LQYGTSLRIFDTYVWFITTFYLRRLLHEIPVGKNLVHAKGTLIPLLAVNRSFRAPLVRYFRKNSVLAELGSSVQNSTPTSIFSVGTYITYVRKHVSEEMTVANLNISGTYNTQLVLT